MKTLLYIWQLPQNLLGYLLLLFFKADTVVPFRGCEIHICPAFPGGVSLGRYIIVAPWATTTDWAHEYGHCRQSRMLGWLYLPIIGIYSGLRSGLHLYKRGHYYEDWCEGWADRLGGVIR